MARLNVDYKRVRNDTRFISLSRKLGCEGKAWEMLLRFWDCAQDYWGKGQLVPELVFDASGDLEPLVQVGLAERRNDGIYARGSEKEFAWYVHLIAMGKKGVKSRQKQKRSSILSGSPEGNPRSQPSGEPYGVLLQSTLFTLSSSEETKTAVADASREAKASPPSPRDLADLWNTHSSPAQKKVALKTFKSGSERWRHAKARLSKEPDLTYWRKVIERIAASPFCNGDNGRGWFANFDFLVRSDTHVKTLEDQYGGAPIGEAGHWTDHLTAEERAQHGLA